MSPPPLLDSSFSSSPPRRGRRKPRVYEDDNHDFDDAEDEMDIENYGDWPPGVSRSVSMWGFGDYSNVLPNHLPNNADHAG
jgi:hypothetical protein